MKQLRYTFRMLKRNPLLVFVTLPGLAFGLAAFLLLSVYVRHELSYDQQFPTKDRVVRLYNSITQRNSTETSPLSLRSAYTEIPAKVPEIDAAVQIYRGWNVNVERKNKRFEKNQLLYADPGFFDVFGLNLLAGNKKTALRDLNSVVLTVPTAKKFFGTTNCVGKTITISDQPFTVTGVMKQLPTTTHFHFDLLASMSSVHPEKFGGFEFFTYFLLNKNANREQTEAKINALNDQLMKPLADMFNLNANSGIEPLTRIHLHTKADFDLSEKGSLSSIYLIAGLAFFILLLAMINYINLYVLHGEKRIKEIASRKALGADKWTLAKLFYTETGVISFFALFIAFWITELARPWFAHLMQRSLPASDLFSPAGLLIVVAFLILLIFVSGAYPSFNLSGINLVTGLKGQREKQRRKSPLSIASVVVQFSVAVFLITSLIVIRSQISYLKDIPLGFNASHVIEISGLNKDTKTHRHAIKEELSKLPFVTSAAASIHNMGSGSSGQGIKLYSDASGNLNSIHEYRVHPGFGKTMQLHLLQGRFFDDRETDHMAVILNEAAVKMLGLKDPVGKLVTMYKDPMKIIGVVKDFYYNSSSSEKIAPLMLTNYSDKVNCFYVRIPGKFTKAEQKQVASIFQQYDPNFIFSTYELTDRYNEKFANEERVMRLISAGTVLAIIISFMGIMALSIFTTARRTKEIGVRKVMGSSVREILQLLLFDMLIWVVGAMLLAFAADYFALNHWLSNYANRVSLHPGYFIISGMFALLVATAAVGWQSWKAATRNPVDALRYE
ncbi:ABC transporter permease [Prolixibacter denitrificans]|uniref:ABC transporter permease n=1 Tax=Prolixibacter denitrificans TaxID=1541063 RepID=A0A2P8CH72_9BACT|nr:ABC transporter permease [Prolixibacter denitrificans]PSK84311.1 putative ABC transport system permease protein [Prolixibacter denitrificans]GET20487.1 ABC transporter permease [Prolixibacter denitrificans]